MKSNFSLTELSQNSSDRGLADSVREKGSRLSPLFHMGVAAGVGGSGASPNIIPNNKHKIVDTKHISLEKKG